MRSFALHVASWLSLAAATVLHGDTFTWRNTGTDWLTEANWNPTGVPGPGDLALLPNSTAIAFQPTLGGPAAIDGIEFRNYYNQTWIVGGAGTLTLGGAGLAMTGARTENRIDAPVALDGHQTWYFQSNENRGYAFRLNGTLSGTGDLTLEERRGDALCAWRFGNGTSRVPADFTLDGAVAILRATTETELNVGPQAASADFAFGGTAASPQPLRIGDGARFRFLASAASSGVTTRLVNPIHLAAGGGSLALVASGTVPPQLELAGGATLGGPVALYRANALPEPTYGSVWTLPQDRGATAGILHLEPGYDLIAHTVGAAPVDGPGDFANPLLVQSFMRDLTLAGPAASCTYARGTVVDFCGTPYKSETQVARVLVGASSRLGTGGLRVLPGGRLHLAAATGLAGGQSVDLLSSSAASAVVAVGFDGLPVIANTAHGVVAIDGTYSGSLDLATLGDGACYLGTSSGGSFTGTTLAPAADGAWRLGAGGGAMNALTVTKPVLTGDSDLLVGRSAWQGNGAVLLTAANTFTGDIDVTGITYFNREPYAHGSGFVGSQLGASSLAAGSALGDPAGIVRLRNSRLLFQQAVSADASVRKQTLQFEGRSRLHSNFNNNIGQMLFGNLVRSNRGTLTLQDERSSFAVRERIVVDTPPAEANGIAPAWLVHERGPHFVTHDAAVGFKDFTGYVADINAAGPNDVVGTAAANLTANRACHALRNTGALGGAFTLSVGSGGILMGQAISCGVDFGANEGLVYSFTTAQLSGSIAGGNGLTLCGNVFDSRAAHTFTGDLTVNGCAYWARFDESGGTYSFGHADNDIVLNGGALVRQTGDRVLASRTITLGAGGGAIVGNATTIYAKITGAGMLMIGNGASASAGLVTLSNADNDYAGGTFLLSAGGDRKSGSLMATSTGSLGTGDLVVNAYLLATLQGDANLDAGATAHVAMAGLLRFEGSAPLVGGLVGGGMIELGTSTSATTLSVGGDDRSSTFHGRLVDRAAAYPGALTKVGNGRFTLYGAHAFTGATTVQAGEFALHGSLAGDLAVEPGGTLVALVDASGKARRGHVDGDVTLSGTLTLDGEGASGIPIGGTLTVLTCDGTLTANSAIPPDGFTIGTSGGVLTLTRAANGTVVVVR